MEDTLKKAADKVKHALTCEDYAARKINQWTDKANDFINGRPRVQELDDLEGFDF